MSMDLRHESAAVAVDSKSRKRKSMHNDEGHKKRYKGGKKVASSDERKVDKWAAQYAAHLHDVYDTVFPTWDIEQVGDWLYQTLNDRQVWTEFALLEHHQGVLFYMLKSGHDYSLMEALSADAYDDSSLRDKLVFMVPTHQLDNSDDDEYEAVSTIVKDFEISNAIDRSWFDKWKKESPQRLRFHHDRIMNLRTNAYADSKATASDVDEPLASAAPAGAAAAAVAAAPHTNSGGEESDDDDLPAVASPSPVAAVADAAAAVVIDGQLQQQATLDRQ